MDIERIIDEIQQLEEMFEALDINHSAPETSLPPTESTMRCSRTARGFGCGSDMGCVADLASRTPIRRSERLTLPTRQRR
jgi:hypothetical protein